MDVVTDLNASTEMEPVTGEVTVHIPLDVLWGLFGQAHLWPKWNDCFYWVRNNELLPGQRLTWVFQPIKPWYLYKMPAIANIVSVETGHEATWHVAALPGFFARHTFRLAPVGPTMTTFGSWEKAMGPGFRITRGFWVAHFRFVLEKSLEGARRLEDIYGREGMLDAGVLPP